MGNKKKKYWSSFGEINFWVVWEIHLDQRSDQLLSRCRTGWSNARRWFRKWPGRWWNSWRPTWGWWRTTWGRLATTWRRPGATWWRNTSAVTMSLPFRYINCPIHKPLKTHLTTALKTVPLAILITINHTVNTILIFDIVSKVIVGAIILLISLPFYWLLGRPLPCRQHQSMKCFPFIFRDEIETLSLSISRFETRMDFLS